MAPRHHLLAAGLALALVLTAATPTQARSCRGEVKLARKLCKLQSRDTCERARVVADLAYLKVESSKVLPALVQAFDRPDGSADKGCSFWRETAKTIKHLGGKKAIAMLIKVLRAKRNASKQGAALTLSLYGAAAAPAIKVLARLARVGAVGVASQSAKTLGAIGASAVAALIKIVRRRRAGVCSHAATALGTIGPAALKALRTLRWASKQNKPKNLAKQSALALGGLGPKAIPALVFVLMKTKQKPAARTALLRIGSPALPALRRLHKRRRSEMVAKLISEIEAQP